MEIKYYRPTSQNKEDHGYIWHADLESGDELWINLGDDQEVQWMRLGNLFEKYGLKNFLFEEFLEELLQDYANELGKHAEQ